MFIIWGSRNREHKLGYVAEFCPVCRKITPFQVRAISRVGHFYGVSMGRGDLLGHTGTCQVCANRFAVNVADYYDMAKEPGDDLSALIRQTFPGIPALRGKRLGLEECLRTGTLYPAEREGLIMEAFQVFAELTDANFSGSTEIRGRGGWGCLGTIVLCIAVTIAGVLLVDSPGGSESVTRAVTAIAVIGGIGSLVLLVLEPGRIFARKILPDFARTLRPLSPSLEDLADILARFRRAGYKLGKKLKPERLWKALNALPAPETPAAPGTRQDAPSRPPPIPVDHAALAAAERSTRLMQTFQSFANLTQSTYGGGIHIRGRGGWGCLGTLLLCIAVAWVGCSLVDSREQEDGIMGAVTIIAGLGFVSSFVLLLLEPDRILTRRILPELVAALRPLEPTCEEINDILMRFRAAGFKLGTKVRPEWLCAALDARPAQPLPPEAERRPKPPEYNDGLF